MIWYFPTRSTAAWLGWSPAAIFIRTLGLRTFAQYDLAGNVVLQTNLEILNEQLAAKGYPTMHCIQRP